MKNHLSRVIFLLDKNPSLKGSPLSFQDQSWVGKGREATGASSWRMSRFRLGVWVTTDRASSTFAVELGCQGLGVH